MASIDLQDDKTFALGGERFVVDVSARNRRPSDGDAFTIVKGENFLRIYQNLAAALKSPPRSILELGIFQGGSFVFLDKLFAPRKMAALDISATPVSPLIEYLARTPDRYAHFGLSQTDEPALKKIVADELDDELDLVIDDASHGYEHTKRSFEILFPLLQRNGIYVIEDWAWAHQPAHQTPDSPFGSRSALTNLLYEQIALLGSTADIAEIRIMKPLCMIRKSASARVGHTDVWDGTLLRGRKLHPI